MIYLMGCGNPEQYRSADTRGNTAFHSAQFIFIPPTQSSCHWFVPPPLQYSMVICSCLCLLRLFLSVSVPIWDTGTVFCLALSLSVFTADLFLSLSLGPICPCSFVLHLVLSLAWLFYFHFNSFCHWFVLPLVPLSVPVPVCDPCLFWPRPCLTIKSSCNWFLGTV